MKARKYQNKAIRELLSNHRHGIRTQMLFAPTGAGKTLMASKLIHRLSRIGLKSVFIAHKKELIWQTVRHLEFYGLKVGILQAENTNWHPGDDVLVATVQTIKSRGLRFAPNVFFIDEAHNLWKEHIKLMESYNALPFIGLSATPLREGLGNHFQALVTKHLR